MSMEIANVCNKVEGVIVRVLDHMKEKYPVYTHQEVMLDKYFKSMMTTRF